SLDMVVIGGYIRVNTISCNQLCKRSKEAINQYVILSSLSGFTGTFQKIGFSGLPLATSALTLVFCALSFTNDEFMELAKLTLGAFIGSFVQRNVDTERIRQERLSTHESDTNT
ncbi:MAG: hypothetical protein AAF327_09875, partial [Cyanobacteria bacterium P01_A01_bin.37]